MTAVLAAVWELLVNFAADRIIDFPVDVRAEYEFTVVSP